MKKKSNPLDYAFRLLSYRDRAWSEIERRMREKDYDFEEIEKVKIKLEELDLIDDSEFASSYIENKKKRFWGPIRIKAELFRFGIPKTEIENRCDEHDWKELLDHAVAKYKDKFVGQKLATKLHRLGFPTSWIWESISHLDK